jgi:PAS domain S-box-containing protein
MDKDPFFSGKAGNPIAQFTGIHQFGTDLDYRAIFEQTAEYVFIFDLDYKFITANSQALQLLGYEEHDLAGLPVGEVLLIENAQKQELLLGKYLNVSDGTLKKKNGNLLPVDLYLSVVNVRPGPTIYIQMHARDISEHKQVEINLKRHIHALSVIGDVAASLFSSSNLETKIPEVLESLGCAMDVFCCALLELDMTHIKIQAQWTNIDTSNFDIAFVLVPFIDSIREDPGHVFSVRNVKTENAEIPVVSILVIPVQGILGIWGSLVLFDKQNQMDWLTNEFDVVQTTANLIGAAMERVHYEKTIRLNEAHSRIIVDALPDLLLRTDLSGQILDYSAHSSHPLYLQRESVIGKELSSLWPVEIVNMIIEPNDRNGFLSSHWVYGFNLPGHEQVFEARLHPISLEEALIIVRDITEQARLDQMKSDFINRASHELRTPLTSAILMAELIQLGGPQDEMAEYVSTLMHELSRQKVLIDQLLLAGRLESGRMELIAAPLDLIPVLKESVKAVKVVSNKRQIFVNFLVEQDSIYVLGDVSGLSQVFINLINNAIKFSPVGETVEVLATLEDHEVHISIVDHGLGIPFDAIPHLFERFFRARNVTVAEVPGSGIGLYIVKSIVDELGGRIEVKSELNQGATFTVSLQLSAPHLF